MKTFILSLLAMTAFASAQTVTQAEYYIDSDPGPGNGTAIPVSPAGSISKAVDIPASTIAALSDGTHLLTCRVRDAEGDWSVAFAFPFYKADPAPPEVVPDITAAEYYFDSDPGPGNGIAIPVNPAGSISKAVDIPASTIAALSDGTHLLTCRVRDADGDWSVAFAFPFHKADPDPIVNPVIARIDYRYYQNGSPVSPVYTLSPPSTSNPVSFQELASLAGLLEGETYQMVATPYDDRNVQGIPATENVLVQTTDSNGDGIPDQWKLQYGFEIMDDIAGIDSDLDGLTNLEEFFAGTHPRESDTDGDGMNDRAELDLASLGFDPLVSDSTMVSALRDNANNAGLFSKTQLQALAPAAPLIERDSAGTFRLTLGLDRSTDLVNFNSFPFSVPGTSVNPAGEIEFEFESDDDAAFFRLETRE